MIKIFVSGPYTKGDVAQNVKLSMDLSNELINKGFAPYCPHLTHFLHMNNFQPYEKWLQLDIEYLKCCDGLLRFSGESSGADKEVDFARSEKIPIFFSIEEIVAYYPRAGASM